MFDEVPQTRNSILSNIRIFIKHSIKHKKKMFDEMFERFASTLIKQNFHMTYCKKLQHYTHHVEISKFLKKEAYTFQ